MPDRRYPRRRPVATATCGHGHPVEFHAVAQRRSPADSSPYRAGARILESSVAVFTRNVVEGGSPYGDTAFYHRRGWRTVVCGAGAEGAR